MPPTSTVTVSSRAREFSEDFFVDNGKLMCRFCDHSINFQTKNTITAHIGSKTHICNKKMKIEQTKQGNQLFKLLLTHLKQKKLLYII